MGRFRAAAQVAAFFLIAMCGSRQALACEGCDRAALAGGDSGFSSAGNDIGRVDVTNAVESATSFVVDTFRSLRLLSRFGLARGEVNIAQQDVNAADLQLHDAAYADIVPVEDEFGAALSVAEYAAAYDAIDTHHPAEMPGFRRDYAWQLTYRSEPADTVWQPAPSDRFPGMNTTLDDSWVVGLRFQMDYGWAR